MPFVFFSYTCASWTAGKAPAVGTLVVVQGSEALEEYVLRRAGATVARDVGKVVTEMPALYRVRATATHTTALHQLPGNTLLAVCREPLEDSVLPTWAAVLLDETACARATVLSEAPLCALITSTRLDQPVLHSLCTEAANPPFAPALPPPNVVTGPAAAGAQRKKKRRKRKKTKKRKSKKEEGE